MRLHLFEWEDQPWFPRVLRDAMTDFLGLVAAISKRAYQPFVTKLVAHMQRVGTSHIVDLCSGSGAAAVVITTLAQEQLGGQVRLTLTDLYPNASRFLRAAETASFVTPRLTPVDATQVPSDLPGFRLLVNGFHHLRPELARRVLKSAVRDRQGIAILEVVERSPAGLISVPFGLLLLFAGMPFVRPFRFSRLFFTYIVPLVPLFTLWDGWVSCLRIYSPTELQRLVEGLEGYDWDIGRARTPGAPTAITYLFGTPKG